MMDLVLAQVPVLSSRPISALDLRRQLSEALDPPLQAKLRTLSLNRTAAALHTGLDAMLRRVMQTLAEQLDTPLQTQVYQPTRHDRDAVR